MPIMLNTASVMGILNCTPDSFSDGGMFFNEKNAINHAYDMIEQGAKIIDIGGESTRPKATLIDSDVEWSRIKNVIAELSDKTIISIDSYKPNIIKKSLDFGAKIINNIAEITHSTYILELAKQYDVKVVIMHNSRNRTIFNNNIIDDCEKYFAHAIKLAQSVGINNDNIMLDPGIGFGTTAAQDIELLSRLHELTNKFHQTFLLGASKKSFIGKILDEKDPQKRKYATMATTIVGYLKGCKIFRVHDVKENIDALKMAEAIYG